MSPAFRPTRPTFIGHTTAPHSLTSGFHSLPVDVVDQDDATGWDGSTYTCDRPGLWLAHMFASRNSVAAAAKPFARLQVNGVTIGVGTGPTLTQAISFQGTFLFHAETGDVIAPQVQLSASATITLNDDARIFITRIGPKSWNF